MKTNSSQGQPFARRDIWRAGKPFRTVGISSRLTMNGARRWLWANLLGYLFSITAAEALVALLSPTPGLILHGLVLMILLVESSRQRTQAERRLYLCLALAPLIRLLSLSIPLGMFVPYAWYAVIGAPLFLAALMVAIYTGFRPSEVGLVFGQLPLELLLGFSGIGLGFLEYLILRPGPLVPTFSWQAAWLPGLVLLVFTGLLEEFIFRGLLQRASADLLGKAVGLLFTAAVFAVLHLGYRSALDMAFVFAVAIYFGYNVQKGGSLVGVALAHGLTNVCLYLVFPFLLGRP